MSKKNILIAKKISKQYRLGLVGTGTISHDINRWWHKIRGKQDPYLKIGDINERSSKGNSDYVWALQDINFEVERGEVLGIIGKNGAGKSTLLKILSRVTGPTTGEIKTKGRIASLLEVGTGFHPELTGRENIFLNGAILGMTKDEIQTKIDEIIEFSGCKRFIDTPVKRYSSGMTVRLAFAVAAHLEPDILVIDEVLAVGDAEFQKKAIGKMQDISRGQGRTVLFVSHNMAAIRNLCTRAMVLQNGRTVFEGDTNKAVNFYLKNDVKNNSAIYRNESQKETSDILEIKVLNSNDEVTSIFGFEGKIKLQIKLKITRDYLDNAVIGFRLKDQFERVIFSSEKMLNEIVNESGIASVTANLPSAILVPNDYRIVIGFYVPNKEMITLVEDAVMFRIEETGSEMHRYHGKDYGCVVLPCEWN